MRTRTEHGLPLSALALLALLALPLAAASADSTEGWKLGKTTLKSDYDTGGGLIAKAGEAQIWYRSAGSGNEQRTAMITLAKDATLPNGMTVKAGTALGLYPNAAIHFLTLASDWTPPGAAPGFALMGGTKVFMYDDGSFQEFRPRNDLDTGPGQPRIKGGEYVALYRGGRYQSVVFTEPVPVQGLPLKAAAGYRLGFYESGALKSFRPSEPGLVYAGITAGTKEDVTLYEKTGKVLSCALAAPIRTKAGALVGADRVEFDASGAITRGILDAPYAGPAGPAFRAGDRVSFAADGAPKAPEKKPGEADEPVLPYGMTDEWSFDRYYWLLQKEAEYEDEQSEFGY
jgi:hypothetical protein